MPHTIIEIPSRLPLYTQKEAVVFPYMLFPLYVSEKDVAVFRETDNYEKYIVLVFERPEDLKMDFRAAGARLEHSVRLTRLINWMTAAIRFRWRVTRLRILDTEPAGALTLAHCEIVREFVEKKSCIRSAGSESERLVENSAFARKAAP